MEEKIYEGREIKRHPYRQDPYSFFGDYVGVFQLIQKRMKKDAGLVGWRECKTRIQYQGWTCDVDLIWSYRGANYYVDDVKLYAVKKAPLPENQMELSC